MARDIGRESAKAIVINDAFARRYYGAVPAVGRMFEGRFGTEDDSAGLYAAWQEWEAETGATILSEFARHPPHPRWVQRSAAAHENGLAATFGLTTGRWR